MFYVSEMQPATVCFPPAHADFLPENRHWQGIPSIERTERDRLFSVFYSGGRTEENGNFIALLMSDDDGHTWLDPVMAIQHSDVSAMRVFDPNVWLDPLGRLWITYAQSHNFFDGRDGVWAVIIDNPDDAPEMWKISPPRRIANGVMMCKPTILSDGIWLFPCAVWACVESDEKHPEVEHERLSNVYVSTDNGETFSWRGGADVPNRSFDEHMVVERRDGSLWMLVRRYDGIGQAYSYDKGDTWWQAGHSGITGPNSRFFIRRLRSGNLLLVNHVDFRGRNNLMAKLSLDDGKTWTGGLMLDDRDDVSYPDGTQSSEGLIYVTYDRERYKAREILLAVFTEQDILAGRPTGSHCRLRQLISQAGGPIESK